MACWGNLDFLPMKWCNNETTGAGGDRREQADGTFPILSPINAHVHLLFTLENGTKLFHCPLNLEDHADGHTCALEKLLQGLLVPDGGKQYRKCLRFRVRSGSGSGVG